MTKMGASGSSEAGTSGEYVRDPHLTWLKYKWTGHVRRTVTPMPLDTPVYDDKIRFVCISDTHDKLDQILDKIPNGDVLIHAGDFTDDGSIDMVIKFCREIRRLPHRHKIVIAGNHELGFEKLPASELAELKKYGLNEKRQLMTGMKYLLDSHVMVYGYKIYGAPWHPMPYYDFHVPRGPPMQRKWALVPDDTDVLVTHTPPLGHGDLGDWPVAKGMLAGCLDLLDAVESRIQPKYHVFGHVHTQRGITTNDKTTFINACICDRYTQPANDPIIFDLPLKDGFSKS